MEMDNIGDKVEQEKAVPLNPSISHLSCPLPSSRYSQKSVPKRPYQSNKTYQLAKTVAKKLNEKKLQLLVRTIDAIGGHEVKKLVKETLDIEKEGGMKTADGRGWRRLGGIFFTLLKERISKDQLKDIYKFEIVQKKKFKKKKRKLQPMDIDLDGSIQQDIHQQDMEEEPGEVIISPMNPAIENPRFSSRRHDSDDDDQD